MQIKVKNKQTNKYIELTFFFSVYETTNKYYLLSKRSKY